MIIDVETHAFSTGNKLPRIVSLQYCGADEVPGILLHDDARGYAEALLQSDDSIIGHNISFDLGCVATNWPELAPLVFDAYDAGRVRCTMLWNMLQHVSIGLMLNKRPRGYWALSGCCSRAKVKHADKESQWRLRFGELDNVPLHQWPADALEYALVDAVSCKQLADRLPVVPDVANQSRFDYWLTLSSAFGMATDQAMVARWAAAKQARKSELEVALVGAGLVDENGKRCMAKIRSRILDAYGSVAPRTGASTRHPKGQVKTSAEVCRDADDPVLQGM